MGKRVNSVEGGRHCKCKNDNYDKGHLGYNAEMISASLTAAVSHVTLALQNVATFKIGGYFYIWISTPISSLCGKQHELAVGCNIIVNAETQEWIFSNKCISQNVTFFPLGPV